MISFTNELELTLQRETMQWSAVCQLDTRSIAKMNNFICYFLEI